MRYKIASIRAGCRPGTSQIEGRLVDAVLELPAGVAASNGLRVGQEIEVSEMDKWDADQSYIKQVQDYLKAMGYGNTRATGVEKAIRWTGESPDTIDAFDMASEIQRMLQQGEEMDFLWGTDITAEKCPACLRLKANCKGTVGCYRAAGVRVGSLPEGGLVAYSHLQKAIEIVTIISNEYQTRGRAGEALNELRDVDDWMNKSW